VADRLSGETEIVPITTSGDTQVGTGAPRGTRRRPRGTPELADKSRFVKEIEEALLRGDVDLGVHSAKDVPAELPDGLAIVGVPARADPRDALCGAATLNDLAEGSLVGTASLRRRAELLALRPDLDVRVLRGNVDTRLRRLADGDFDAIVLAQAGLERLGRAEEGAPLHATEFIPAAGQGCLVLEARADRAEVAEAASALTDQAALAALTAERALVQTLEATCNTPVGAHAVIDGEELRLTAFAGLPDGSHWIRDELAGRSHDPAGVGAAVATRMLAAGAADLLATAEAAAGRS
jgi:hydroxymethylbilane synthase